MLARLAKLAAISREIRSGMQKESAGLPAGLKTTGKVMLGAGAVGLGGVAAAGAHKKFQTGFDPVAQEFRRGPIQGSQQ